MIDYNKLIETAEYHIKRGDGMVMDPGVIREMAQINQQLVKTLQDISATAYSNADRDKARAALAAAKQD